MDVGNYSLYLPSPSSFRQFLPHSLGLKEPIRVGQEWICNCPRPIKSLLRSFLLELEGGEYPYVTFGSQDLRVGPEACT